MKSTLFWAATLLGLLIVGMGLNGECRSWAAAAWYQAAGWSEEARLAHPREFARFAAGQLRDDLASLEAARRDLENERTALVAERREQQSLHAATERRVTEVADLIRRGTPDGEEGLDALFTTLQEQEKAQAETCRDLARMEEEIGKRLDALTLRLADTHAQVVALEVQLAEPVSPADEVAPLLSRADELLRENARWVSSLDRPADGSEPRLVAVPQTERRAARPYHQRPVPWSKHRAKGARPMFAQY